VCHQIRILVSLTSFCLLIVGVECYCCTWSHWMTRTHSVGLLWTRDWPLTEACICTTHKRVTSMPPAEFEPSPSKWAHADLWLRRRGHRDRHQRDVHILNIKICSRNVWYGQRHRQYSAREKCEIRRRRHNRYLILFVLSLSIAWSCLLGCLSWVSSSYVIDCVLAPTALQFVFTLPRRLKDSLIQTKKMF